MLKEFCPKTWTIQKDVLSSLYQKQKTMKPTIILSLNNGCTWDVTFFNLGGSMPNGTTVPTGWNFMDKTSELVEEMQRINPDCIVAVLHEIIVHA